MTVSLAGEVEAAQSRRVTGRSADPDPPGRQESDPAVLCIAAFSDSQASAQQIHIDYDARVCQELRQSDQAQPKTSRKRAGRGPHGPETDLQGMPLPWCAR
jgi:hypothetical protein